MSKGYSSAMALIEAGKQMALATIKEKPMRTRPDKKEKPVDLMGLLEQKRREYLAVKQFVEEQHKLNKPEDKKEEKKAAKFGERELLLMLMGLSPIIGAVALHILRL